MAIKGMTAENVDDLAGGTVHVGRSRHYIHVPHSLGERLADTIAAGMGSWTFIIWQSAVVLIWITLNLVAIGLKWDPYPFILLNLLFSTQAAYAAPIIMMSQNRSAQKDHIRDDHEAEEVDLLYQINQQQLEILALLRRQICEPAELTRATEPSSAPAPQGTTGQAATKPSGASPRRRR